MLTPKQLYETYSLYPCANGFVHPRGEAVHYDWSRIVKFLKHLQHPCYGDINTPDIDGTGAGQLALPFKFLQQYFDIEAFAEGQPQVAGGTAYAVRNSADLARSCYFYAKGEQSSWFARMATEYLEHFCGNSLPDCLMMLGPDLLPESEAYDKAPSSLGCGIYYGATGGFFCQAPQGGSSASAASCICCPPPEGLECEPNDPRDECAPEPIRENICCKVNRTSRVDFSYILQPEDANGLPFTITHNTKVYFSTNVTSMDQIGALESSIVSKIAQQDILVVATDTTSRQTWIFTGNNAKQASSYKRLTSFVQHIGVLERKNHNTGYANFVTRSGNNFHAILDDIFLEYFIQTNAPLKCKTISIILSLTGSAPNISTNTTDMLNSIKDLLYHGYGIVLMSNVGFPNTRDSTGITYPDRIWYQTYSIIGYDDRKLEYPECVYVLSCPFGDWISGGHPSWGPLPPGCFLVTESHLRCMLNFNPGMDFYPCRKKICNPVLYDCQSPEATLLFAGCGSPEEGKCYPYYCTEQQSAFGIAFALSFHDGFPAQTLPHEDFYPVTAIREQTKEQTLYFIP